mmetsp:Transcript_31392/g.45962  ORF Transcript_31392/g.45962 Transcript_31392/m.45962 type:complete len:112 (+) Transcript_31392:524-859(+)
MRGVRVYGIFYCCFCYHYCDGPSCCEALCIYLNQGMSSELFLFDRAVANSFSKLEKQDKNIMLSQTATSSALDTPPPFQHAVHNNFIKVIMCFGSLLIRKVKKAEEATVLW